MIVTIDQSSCKGCGICAEVCPRHIPVSTTNGSDETTTISTERLGLCLECGHCAAVCPTGAVQVALLKEEEYAPVNPPGLDADQLLSLLRHRRSVRTYRKKPVPREEIDRIIDAVDASPCASGRRTTGVIVIDDPETLAGLSELLYKRYEKLEKGLNNPIARYFIRKQTGDQVMNTLQNFVMPGMHWYIRWYREGKSNEILRNCPALMLFHTPVNEPMGSENCLIAAFHAVVMAQAIGIGTCLNGLVPPACNKVPEARKLLDLPPNREIHAAITLGYPKHRFKRTPPRRLAEVRYLELPKASGCRPAG